MWAEGRPLARSEIIELSINKSWKPSSIHILLNSMLEKDAIRVDGFVKTGTHYGRTFVPTLDEAQYAADQIRQMEAFQKDPAGTVARVLDALLDHVEADDQTYQQLEQLLRDKRAQKPKGKTKGSQN